MNFPYVLQYQENPVVKRGVRRYGSLKRLLVPLTPTRPKSKQLRLQTSTKLVWLIRRLLVHKWDVEEYGYYGNAPIHRAIDSGNYLTCRLLVTIANIEKNNWRCETPLYRATYSLEICKLLVPIANLNQLTELDDSALNRSIGRNQNDVAKLLIESGADIESPEWDRPLITATYKNNVEICRLLLDHKVNVNAIDLKDGTALHIAATMKHDTICKMLVEAGADLTIRNSSGYLPQDVVCSEEMYNLLKI